ncbi:hypothetical protein ARMA_2465 [Ardenticatena maritima]|uniref:Uncharacterized protein n=1 Tax=Ardenticatena maritima TaxID=872965 RepID=A0A0M8KAG2_9CHLR|nr:hypothetical protein ARMA_2465 [Ardenticatena maritima]
MKTAHKCEPSFALQSVSSYVDQWNVMFHSHRLPVCSYGQV